jgi:hypothetical protein
VHGERFGIQGLSLFDPARSIDRFDEKRLLSQLNVYNPARVLGASAKKTRKATERTGRPIQDITIFPSDFVIGHRKGRLASEGNKARNRDFYVHKDSTLEKVFICFPTQRFSGLVGDGLGFGEGGSFAFQINSHVFMWC